MPAPGRPSTTIRSRDAALAGGGAPFSIWAPCEERGEIRCSCPSFSSCPAASSKGREYSLAVIQVLISREIRSSSESWPRLSMLCTAASSKGPVTSCRGILLPPSRGTDAALQTYQSSAIRHSPHQRGLRDLTDRRSVAGSWTNTAPLRAAERQFTTSTCWAPCSPVTDKVRCAKQHSTPCHGPVNALGDSLEACCWSERRLISLRSWGTLRQAQGRRMLPGVFHVESACLAEPRGANRRSTLASEHEGPDGDRRPGADQIPARNRWRWPADPHC